MGSEVEAKYDCGIEKRILIGGGMTNFMTTCYFPCLCEQCVDVVQVNLLKKRCPKCRSPRVVPFDDPTLSESPGEHLVAYWNMEDELGRDLELTAMDATGACTPNLRRTSRINIERRGVPLVHPRS